MQTSKMLSQAFEKMYQTDVRSCTVFRDKNFRVTITKRFKAWNHKSQDFILTAGAPNYAGRKLVKKATKFPFIHTRLWSKKR